MQKCSFFKICMSIFLGTRSQNGFCPKCSNQKGARTHKHIHMHIHGPWRGRQGGRDGGGRADGWAGAHVRYMYLYMYMHMYMFVCTCSFLVGTFGAETILGPCPQKNGHAYFEKRSTFSFFPKWLPRPNHSAH